MRLFAKQTIWKAFERGYISKWEMDFLESILAFKKLSDKQLSVAERINGVILSKFSKGSKYLMYHDDLVAGLNSAKNPFTEWDLSKNEPKGKGKKLRIVKDDRDISGMTLVDKVEFIEKYGRK